MGRAEGLQLLSPRTAACSDTASSIEENGSGELGAQRKAWVSEGEDRLIALLPSQQFSDSWRVRRGLCCPDCSDSLSESTRKH